VIGLADTSAWTAKHRDETAAHEFDALVLDGSVATCDVVRFELLFGVQDRREFTARREALGALVDDRHFELIAEVTGQPVRAIAPLGSL
jgi:uncharacterized protein with PIN domain